MRESKEQQLFFMREALRLGEQGRKSAPPNPWVGCVLVKNGAIVGRGYHVKPGALHAEVMAIEEAQEAARGATAYITLEPCAHTGRTPPCVEALIRSRVERVVIPFVDPDPISSGGVDVLRQRGIAVEIGVAQEEARRALAPYLYHRKTGMPYCVLKTATSIDGSTAAADGSSKWITSPAARKDAKELRTFSQAIMVGSETARVDLPALREAPLRVIYDRRGRVEERGPLFDGSPPTLILTESTRQWKNAESVQVTSLRDALLHLGKRGVIQLFVEGGSTLHAAFMRAGFVQKWVVYLGNCFLGEGKRMPLEVASIDEAPRFELESVLKIGDDVRLTYLPRGGE